MRHEDYMRIAIDYAKAKNPIWPFAALIVDSNGDILIRACNASQISPTFHGEVVALNALAAEYSTEDINGPLTLYTTGECCPMCQSAIFWANLSQWRIETVVFGSTIETLHGIWGTQIQIRAQTVVDNSPVNPVILIPQVLEPECDKLFDVAKRFQDRSTVSAESVTQRLSLNLADFYETPKKDLKAVDSDTCTLVGV